MGLDKPAPNNKISKANLRYLLSYYQLNSFAVAPPFQSGMFWHTASRLSCSYLHSTPLFEEVENGTNLSRTCSFAGA